MQPDKIEAEYRHTHAHLYPQALQAATTLGELLDAAEGLPPWSDDDD